MQVGSFMIPELKSMKFHNLFHVVASMAFGIYALDKAAFTPVNRDFVEKWHFFIQKSKASKRMKNPLEASHWHFLVNPPSHFTSQKVRD